MVRIICRESIINEAGVLVSTEWKTVDVDDPPLEAYLRAAVPPSRRSIVGGELLDTAPGPDPGPGPSPVPPDPSTLLLDVPAGVPVDENAFGFTVLHGGAAWYSPQMTPEGGATGGRMRFKWSRQFISWSGEVERVPGVYDWSKITARSDYFAQRQLLWSVVLTPVAPSHYGGPLRGPAPTEEPYRKVLASLFSTFWSKGLRAIEICNEPETDNWYGSLGRKPANATEIRRVARELSPWARVAREAAVAYFAATGNRVEVWASSSQSMADASPTTGLARIFNDPSPAANTAYGGLGFLNGPDGKGGTAARWLDRFTFHGYPNPTHDGTLLHAHFLKAKGWLAAAGVPALPIVVTEHGVLSDRNPANGNKASGAFREWKTDAPYTGKAPPFTAQEQVRWLLNAFAVSAIHGARLIWYAWDEQYMGIYGWANGAQGGSATAPLGWVPSHPELELKYAALRTALVGHRVFSLWRRNSDGLFTILVGDARETAILIPLE